MTRTVKVRPMERAIGSMRTDGMWFACAPASAVGVFFFFSSRRRHTRFDCDWSSDVCSSDLLTIDVVEVGTVVEAVKEHRIDVTIVGPEAPLAAGLADALRAAGRPVFGQIGRASGRGRGEISVVGVSFKKKNK